MAQPAPFWGDALLRRQAEWATMHARRIRQAAGAGATLSLAAEQSADDQALNEQLMALRSLTQRAAQASAGLAVR